MQPICCQEMTSHVVHNVMCLENPYKMHLLCVQMARESCVFIAKYFGQEANA